MKNFIKKILFFFRLYKTGQIWPKMSQKKIQYFKENIKIHSSIKTIEDIKTTIINKEKGAYMRFGDGDLFLMMGMDEMLQRANNRMTLEMKEAMNLNIGKLHKGYPLHSNIFGFEKGMVKNMHLVSDNDAVKFLSSIYKFIDLNNIYSPVALHYLSTFNQKVCVDFLKFLRGTNPVFVGNEIIKKEIVNKVFGNIHIKTPSSNSYEEIDRIENELTAALDIFPNQYRVVIIAMGCSGRILQKRMLIKGYNIYMFDFGSLLDAFNENNTRLWIEMSGGVNSFKKILDNLDY